MDRDKFLQDATGTWVQASCIVAAHVLSDRCVATEATGETALRWAVFTDGIEQYWQLARDPSAWPSKRFQAEEEWVLAEDHHYPLSFVNLCKGFGLKADEIRSVLLAWKHAHGAVQSQVPPRV
jgi:hypothetical protein